MNPTLFYKISEAINYIWKENDIYIILASMFVLSSMGLAWVCFLYYEWLFDLIEEDNERTYYLNTSRRYES